MKRSIALLFLFLAACYPYLIQTPTSECGNGTVELGEACEPPGAGSCDDACQILASCGDGIPDPEEGCDDGNNVSGDGCRADCSVERCGDGIVDTSEECDDGNQVDTDDCLPNCLHARCGDGATQVGVEECDDANLIETDACRNNCVSARCGDGIVQSGIESCDPPNGGSCNANCQLVCENNGQCQDNDACTTNNRCENNVCVSEVVPVDDGDVCTIDACDPNSGVTHAAVATDDGNACTEDACDPQNGVSNTPIDPNDNNACTIDACNPATGVSNDDIFFDDGNDCTTDGCDSVLGEIHSNASQGATCGLTGGVVGACFDGVCLANECGDNILNPATEECEGGNLNGQTCETEGFPGGTLQCQSDCTLDISLCIRCGNGIIEDGEACDDGNNEANDGCNPVCKLEADLFVSCGTPDNSAEDGSLANPFNTLSEAIVDAQALQVIMILPQSPTACRSGEVAINNNNTLSIVVISKSLIIQGYANPKAPELPPKPMIDTSDATNLPAIVTNTNGTTVVVRDLILRSQGDGGTVLVGGSAQVALLRTEISNVDNESKANAVAVDCNSSSAGRLLIDQSILHDSPVGLLRARGSCQAVVANSLFLNNNLVSNGASTSRGAIEMEANNVDVDVLYTTFVNNRDGGDGDACFDDDGTNAVGRLFSSIADDSNIGPSCVDSSIILTFSNIKNAANSANNVIDEEPLFTTLGVGLAAPFHLSAQSTSKNTAGTSANFTPLFDYPLFGNLLTGSIFDHDFAGNPRPKNNSQPDMGMFEDF